MAIHVEITLNAQGDHRIHINGAADDLDLFWTEI